MNFKRVEPAVPIHGNNVLSQIVRPKIGCTTLNNQNKCLLSNEAQSGKGLNRQIVLAFMEVGALHVSQTLFFNDPSIL